jgi:hypothetical protein
LLTRFVARTKFFFDLKKGRVKKSETLVIGLISNLNNMNKKNTTTINKLTNKITNKKKIKRTRLELILVIKQFNVEW